jgi:hypothetical protein
VVAVVSVQWRKSKAQDEARQRREAERRLAQALERADAYARGDRAAMERDDVQVLLNAVRTREAT